MSASLGSYWRGEHSCTGWSCTAPKLSCGNRASIIINRPPTSAHVQGTRYMRRRLPSFSHFSANRCAAGLAMHAQRLAAYRSAVGFALASERGPLRRDSIRLETPLYFGFRLLGLAVESRLLDAEEDSSCFSVRFLRVFQFDPKRCCSWFLFYRICSLRPFLTEFVTETTETKLTNHIEPIEPWLLETDLTARRSTGPCSTSIST